MSNHKKSDKKQLHHKAGVHAVQKSDKTKKETLWAKQEILQAKIQGAARKYKNCLFVDIINVDME